jgi:hypothetical protein
MQEAWLDSKGNVGMEADYEDFRGLRNHPSIAGAFYAARLAVSEHLNRIKRKAGVLVLREIRPQYILPVGVWQVREGIREALRGHFEEFENIERALTFACSSLSISKYEWVNNSKIYRIVKEQKRISEY